MIPTSDKEKRDIDILWLKYKARKRDLKLARKEYDDERKKDYAYKSPVTSDDE